MVDIYVLNVRQPILARETYGTIKKRLFDGRQFIEITIAKKKKEILLKTNIRRVVNHG